MKQTKRLLLAVLCIVLVLASALAIVAACGETETGYSLTLSFDKDQGNVTATKPAEGTLYDSGEKITVTVTPAENFEVASFKVNGTDSQIPTGGGTYEFNITADTTVAVTFNAKQDTPPVTYTVTITKTPQDGGEVSLEPQKDSYTSGEHVVASVVPASGYAIKSVKANDALLTANAQGKFEFDVSANTALAVEFGVTREIAVNAGEHGSIVLSPAEGPYFDGSTVTATVTPDAHYLVKSFTVDGEDQELEDGKFTFTLTANVAIAATFKPEQYSVFVSYVDSDERGNVTLDPQQDTYTYGTKVTATLHPGEGFASGNVLVNGVKAEVTDEKFTFTVEDETDILVKFLNQGEIALASLQGSVEFDGQWVNFNYNTNAPDSVYQLKTVFDAEHDAVLMMRMEDGVIGTYWIYRNVGGYPAMVTHDPSGAYVEDQYSDSPWEEFGNPFVNMDGDDLVDLGGGYYTISDYDTIQLVLQTVIGFQGDVDSIEFFAEDGKFVWMQVVYTRDVYDYGGETEDFRYTMTFDIVNHGTAEIPAENFADYKFTDGHAALKNALEQAADATSYTIHFRSSDGEDEDNVYDIIYNSEEGIYLGAEGDENGYVFRADKQLWRFSTQKEQLVFETSSHPLSYLRAYFELADGDDEYYILFEDKGNGVFEIRDIDQYNYEFCGDFASLFASGEEQIELFGMATSLRIILQDNKLYQVEFHYDIDGIYSEDVVLTFDFNEAHLPAEILSEAQKPGFVNEEFIGSWSNKDGSFTLDVNAYGITMGYISYDYYEDEYYRETSAVEDLVALPDGSGYSFSCDRAEYTFTKDESGKFILDYPAYEETYDMFPCSWGEFLGTYSGYNGDEELIVVTIAVDGITIAVGDAEPVAVTGLTADWFVGEDEEGYTVEVFQFDFTFNGKAYWLQQYESYYYGSGFLFGEGGSREGYVLTIADEEEAAADWTFEGTFSDKDYTLKVEAEQLTLTVKGGSPVVIPKADITFTVESINEYTTLETFIFKIDGVTYSFGATHLSYSSYLDMVEYGYFVSDEDDAYHVLVAEDYKLDWSDYVGLYKGSYLNWDTFETEFVAIEFSEDKVVVVLGGQEYTAEVVYYSYYEDIILMFVDGTLYQLSSEYDEDSYEYTYFFQDTEQNVYATMEEVDNSEPWVYNGEFSNKDGTKVLFDAANKTLTITIDGKAYQGKYIEFGFEDGYGYVFQFIVDGEQYFLQQLGVEENKLWLYDMAETVDEYVYAAGYKSDFSAFEGTWTAKVDEDTYEFVITADGVTFKFNGTEQKLEFVDCTKWNDGYEIELVWNGMTYYVDTLYNSDDLIEMVDADETFDILLESSEAEQLLFVDFVEYGTYVGSKRDVDYTVEVTPLSISVTVGDAEPVVSEEFTYSYSDGLFSLLFTDSDDSYELRVFYKSEIQLLINGKSVFLQLRERWTTEEDITDSYILADLAGYYADEDSGATLTVDEQGNLVFTFGSFKDQKATDIKVVRFTDIYKNHDTYITFKLGDQQFRLEILSSYLILTNGLQEDEEGYIEYNLNETEPPLIIPEKYRGTWTGELGVEGTLEITDTDVLWNGSSIKFWFDSDGNLNFTRNDDYVAIVDGDTMNCTSEYGSGTLTRTAA